MTSKFSAEKKAKIGVDGFYNIDKKTFIAKTDRAVKQGELKGLIYDRVYGLTATSQDKISDFIDLHSLSPLAPGTLEAVVVATPVATPSSVSSSSASSSSSPTIVEAPASSKASLISKLERIRKAIDAMKDPSKFVNISTMREVKSGKKELDYNNGLRIAAKKSDSNYLSEVAIALGGSPTGSMQSIDASDDNKDLPTPSSSRVTAKVHLGVLRYGTDASFGKKIEIGVGSPIIKPETLPFSAKIPLVNSFSLIKPKF